MADRRYYIPLSALPEKVREDYLRAVKAKRKADAYKERAKLAEDGVATEKERILAYLKEKGIDGIENGKKSSIFTASYTKTPTFDQLMEAISKRLSQKVVNFIIATRDKLKTTGELNLRIKAN